MSETPKALRLADDLERGETYESHPSVVYGWPCGNGDPTNEAADELRRLHTLKAELLAMLIRLVDMDIAYRRGPVVELAVHEAKALIAKAQQ